MILAKLIFIEAFTILFYFVLNNYWKIAVEMKFYYDMAEFTPNFP
jgi:hypothetical protein